MKFVNPLPFVADMDRAKRFYADVLGLRIVEDHGTFVRFGNGFALHDGAALHRTVFSEPAPRGDTWGRGNLVLYFEDDDIEAACARITGQVDLIHPVRREPWGQRVFRFFDPDGHIVEVGEPQ